MLTVRRLLLNSLIVLFCICPGTAQTAGPVRIDGRVQLASPVSELNAKLYAPKAMLAHGSPSETRSVKFAFIAPDGHFQFLDLRQGSYLLEIYSGERLLYQKVVSTQDPQPLNISLGSISAVPIPSPQSFKQADWFPGDLTSNPSAGVFALDRNSTVSQLLMKSGKPNIAPVFAIPGAYTGYSVAATPEAVFVSANSQLGCTVFRRSLSRDSTSQKVMGIPAELCSGIATDGTAIYVALPKQRAVRYLSNWDSSSLKSWDLSETYEPRSLVFDQVGQRLLVGDQAGHLYGISMSGAKQLLASNMGSVNSIAVSQQHVFVASGRRIISLSRADNHKEEAPSTLRSLTGGSIIGVAVDGNDRLWFADATKGVVRGPIAID